MNKDIKTDIKTRLLPAHELVSAAVRLGLTNMRYILPVSLAVFIPFNILLLFLPADFYQRVQDLEFMLKDSSAGIYVGFSWVILGLFAVFSALAAAAISYITVQSIEEKPIKLTELLDASLMRWGKLTYTAAIYFCFLFLSMPLIFPAFYFGVIFMFYPCIAAISSKYGFSALIISRVLIKGRFWTGFFVFLLNVCVFLAMQSLVDTAQILLGVSGSLFSAYCFNLLRMCMLAFSYIAVCLFYINAHYNFRGKETVK
ncbi:MAG: hypothetical protein LBU77_06435 [Clostridiales bacterium]|nr:hypothetical protein [Clostridiales bacterium]